MPSYTLADYFKEMNKKANSLIVKYDALILGSEESKKVYNEIKILRLEIEDNELYINEIKLYEPRIFNP